jgi:phosphohistidine phosphatase
MVRQLWLLRHAEAEPHGQRTDAQRALTERGEHQATSAGRALARIGVRFEAILASPKVRAFRTAELALAELPPGQRELLATHPPLAGGFGGAQALAALGDISVEGRLLLVGHEPDMSRVLGELTGVRADVKKGGIAMIRMQGSTAGELGVLVRPHEVALIAGEGSA